ncbi:hypothetical protein OIV19_18400 [Brucella sp. HL-2]|nr:hypothetical protein [Brucella sp. HL-2]MCV9909575.1 hypothetical protein [Brucella sp. HL-2]
MIFKTITFALALTGGIIAANYASAAFDDPKTLHVEGKAGATLADYPIGALQNSFPSKVIETQTPWTNGKKVRYRGPALLDVLKKDGLDSSALVTMLGLDDYQSKLEIAEIRKYGPIIATEIACSEAERTKADCSAGQEFRPLTDSDRGPMYIIWPFDALPKAADPGDNSRWVWFVVGLRADS